MTDQQFIRYLKSPDLFSIIMNYLICISTIFGGLLFLNRFFRLSASAHTNVLPLFAGIFLLSIGCYGLWRVAKDYKVIEVMSDCSLEEKKRLIDNYILLVNGHQITIDKAIVKFQYSNKYWNKVDVHIFIDENSFLLNAKSVSIGGTGFIDFGLSKRALKKVETYFRERTDKALVCDNNIEHRKLHY